jgi:two-component system cell cycle response regulator
VQGGAELLTVTISIGVAVMLGEGDTPEALLKRADEALYEAKVAGRNRVVGWAA